MRAIELVRPVEEIWQLRRPPSPALRKPQFVAVAKTVNVTARYGKHLLTLQAQRQIHRALAIIQHCFNTSPALIREKNDRAHCRCLRLAMTPSDCNAKRQ